jgi:hypothetical protein
VYNAYMQHIGAQLKRPQNTSKITERGELMKYFCEKLNRGRIRDNLPPITMGRMGKILQGIPTKDLYYLKASCEDSANWSKKFWWLLDPKKHEGTRDSKPGPKG